MRLISYLICDLNNIKEKNIIQECEYCTVGYRYLVFLILQRERMRQTLVLTFIFSTYHRMCGGYHGMCGVNWECVEFDGLLPIFSLCSESLYFRLRLDRA